MEHERFDPAPWMKKFPLKRLRGKARDYVLRRAREHPEYYADQQAIDDHIDLMYPSARAVIGPEGMAVLEQLREEAMSIAPLIDPVPCDLLVYALGEPPKRHLTKVAGVPYWPAGRDWPVDRDGNILDFLCQFNFCDSRDIIDCDLPGDILSVFLRYDSRWGIVWWIPQEVHCFWLPSGLTDLVRPEDCPTPGEFVQPVHGQFHRTCDYGGQLDAIGARLEYDDDSLWSADATKIGGLPVWHQDPYHDEGVFLGCLGSICSCGKDWLYPFVNCPRFDEQKHGPNRFHALGDGGSLNFFLHDDGNVWAEGDCY
jgi:hypothetical protein